LNNTPCLKKKKGAIFAANKKENGMDRRTVMGLGLAAAAFPKLRRGEFDDFDLKASANLTLA